MIKSAGLVQNLGVAHGFWGNGTFRISFTKMVSPIWGQMMILLSKTIQSQKESRILLLLLMVQKSGVHQL